MEAEVTLKIPQRPYARVEQLAEARRQPVADILAEALDLAEAQSTTETQEEELMAREERAYAAMYEQLRAQYSGEYVAIHNGRLIDHDTNEMVLLQRLNQHYPNDVVLMRQVRTLPEPPLVFRSPRFVQNNTIFSPDAPITTG